MNIIPLRIDEYCQEHSSSPDDVLVELTRQTHLTTIWPQMLSGPLQVALLQMLIKLHQPKTIVEIGTFTGYSSIAMAQAMPSQSSLHTIEVNEELENLIISYFQKAQVDDQIQLHIGDAKKILPVLEGPFDFAFLDADKASYPEYYEMLLPKMNPGGLIVADNVLWSGKVIEPVKEQDKQTKAIIAFNQIVKNDSRVENVLIPIRDGLNVIRVK